MSIQIKANAMAWKTAVVYMSHPGGRETSTPGVSIKNSIAIRTVINPLDIILSYKNIFLFNITIKTWTPIETVSTIAIVSMNCVAV